MKIIEKYREKVNSELLTFLNKKLEKDGKYSKHVKELIENVLEYNVWGGKRIRPLTIISAYKCFKDDDKVIPASICIELMQAYLLIHDDIIDKSDLRRGKPAMHKIYGKKDNHFGISMAILAGDLCASYVYDGIIESDFSDKEKAEAIKYINWIINREIYGQALDISDSFRELKEEDVWKIYELKTATCTMQGPVYIGAVLANASKDKIERLQRYAYNMGLAFQIQDDINGIFGNAEEMGKPNDSDIKEGKKTLLIVKALEFSNKEDREFLLKKYGDSDINETDMIRIREIIKSCSALTHCKNKFNELIEKGKESLMNVELKEEGKDFLLEIADYIKNLS